MPIPFQTVKTLASQRGTVQIDPVTAAKAVNAVPIGPIVNTLKGQEKIPFKKAQSTAQEKIKSFLSLKPQMRALSRVVPTVRSEIALGRQDIDQARQPWETFLGTARVGLSPITGTVRPLLAEPMGALAGEFGANDKQRRMVELAAEIGGNVMVPGLGFPRLSRLAR